MKRNELAKDLRSLSQFLSNWGKNVKNPGILNKMIFNEVGTTMLDYSILQSEPLIFVNIDLDRHCLPLGIEKLNKKDVALEVKLTTSCKETSSDIEDHDPIESLGVNIIASITYEIENEVKDANCSWHLDKDSSTTSIFSHPAYHMNFGGIHMSKQGNVFGKLLLMASPRIIHPPMDIILSCDFIIRNFYEKKNHKSITQEPGYVTLLNRAKERYWKPYTKAFTSKWHNDMTITNLPYNKIVGH